MTTEKLAPHADAAEQAILGSLLIDSDSFTAVDEVVKPSDFFTPENAIIYAACRSVAKRGDGINQITVADELERQGHLDKVGGPAYLSELIDNTPTSLHAVYFASIVKRSSLSRQLIQAAGQIAAIGYEDGPDADHAIAKAEDLLSNISQARSTAGLVPIRQILEAAMAELATPQSEREQTSRIPTGFGDLDRLLGGLTAGDLIILAARPSVGKTSLVVNMAEHAAIRHGARVGIFSLEMSGRQLANRMLASMAGVELQRVSFQQTTDAEGRRIMEATGILSEAAIWIDDAASQTVSAIRSRAKRVHQQHGLDLVIVDYLGLVQGSGRRHNRVEEVGEISHGLKALARDLKVPVLAACQLSRAPELRPDHRPILSDLRESGDLEQDADVVLFIHREDRYYDEQEWHRRNPTKAYPRGIADLIIAKHRNGPIGEARLLFREQLTRFETLTNQSEPPYWAE